MRRKKGLDRTPESGYNNNADDAPSASKHKKPIIYKRSKGGAWLCAKCKKLLAKANEQGQVAGEIKCPRCKLINRR